MSDHSLFYWGMVVTMLVFISALMTAQQLFENYMAGRDERGPR